MPRFRPTPDQRAIANAFSRNAQLLGSQTTVRRLHTAARERFEEPRIGQLVAQVAARQAEFGRGIVGEFRAGRFSAATGLLRPLLETTAWLAWPFSTPDERKQRERLIRLLLQGYRNARDRGVRLPPDVVRLLADTTGKSARSPVDFQQMLKDLDELERSVDDGAEYWVSHYKNFEWASQHVHPSLYGPLPGLDSFEPDQRIGINALVYGHQYLAMSVAICAIAANLADLKSSVDNRYASVAEMQRNQLDRLTNR